MFCRALAIELLGSRIAYALRSPIYWSIRIYGQMLGFKRGYKMLDGDTKLYHT